MTDAREHLAHWLREEEAIGDWLWERMPTFTQDYPGRPEAGAAAKR